MKNKLYIFLMLVAISSLGCQQDSASLAPEASSGSGTAGSYARFLTVGDFLYIIDNENIKTLDVSDASSPELIDEQQVGARIESIFNLEDRLFIGAGSGLYLYRIEADGVPSYAATYPYDQFLIYPCDPVVATDSFAYVTLNTVTAETCRGFANVDVNLLQIFDVTDFSAPQLINTYGLSGPKGLGIDDKTLFVCDNDAGLKIFDVTDPLNIQLIKTFSGFTTYDVIPLNGLLLVVGPESIRQFDYTDLDNIVEVSRIDVTP